MLMGWLVLCFRVPGASVPARWTFLQAADVHTPTPMLPSAPHSNSPLLLSLLQPKWEGEEGAV